MEEELELDESKFVPVYEGETETSQSDVDSYETATSDLSEGCWQVVDECVTEDEGDDAGIGLECTGEASASSVTGPVGLECTGEASVSSVTGRVELECTGEASASSVVGSVGEVIASSTREDGKHQSVVHTRFVVTLPPDNMKLSKHKTKPCPVCPVRVTHLKRHVIRSHLPWYVAAFTACWKCKQQESTPCRLLNVHSKEEGHHSGADFSNDNAVKWCYLMNGLLHYIRAQLQLENLEDLLDLVITRKLYPAFDKSGQDFTINEKLLLMLHIEVMHIKDIGDVQLYPPNYIISLSHWRILSNLLNLLGPESQEKFRAIETYMDLSGLVVGEPITESTSVPSVIDTHFHLDMILAKTNYSTFGQLSSVTVQNCQISKAIANYVFPDHWHNYEEQIGNDSTIYTTFGLHPHLVQFDHIPEYIRQLVHLIKSPRCVGIGEVGLDLTSSCRCRPSCSNISECRKRKLIAQQSLLEQVIPLAARFQKTLVIHCRDNGSGEAARRALNIIVASGFVDIHIHFHCFTGSIEDAKTWESHFENVYFGITSKILSDPELADTAARMNIHRLVVETDSPYLPPDSHIKINTPWNIMKAVNRLSLLKNLPLNATLAFLNENATTLYGL